jgi:hypothetical protein
MLRVILSVIAAYLAMVVVMFALFTGAFFAVGTEGAFQPESFEVSTIWLLISILVLLVAGLAGGYVCRAICPNGNGVFALVVVMLLLGALGVVMVSSAPAGEPTPREGSVANFEAMMKARQPLWFEACKPILGIAGVIVGSRRKK